MLKHTVPVVDAFNGKVILVPWRYRGK